MINLHLDSDPAWSHHELVTADILITARSRFSYTAALLSNGIVISQPRNANIWLRSLDDWVQKFSDGQFDQNKFEIELDKRIQISS